MLDQEEQPRKQMIHKETTDKSRVTESSLSSYLSQDIYCGGYSGEDPPLPIPNREVKLTIADGTAPPGGRVGSCHFLIRTLDIIRYRGFLFCDSGTVLRCLVN